MTDLPKQHTLLWQDWQRDISDGFIKLLERAPSCASTPH